nr:unnamed protein product [Callosobruchus analis]
MEQPSAQQQHTADHASTDTTGSSDAGRHRRSRTVKERVDRVKEKIEPGLNRSLIVPILINIAMVVVGSLAFGKCPVEPYIPFYLVALGIVGFFGKSITTLRRLGGVEYIKSTEAETGLYAVEFMLFLFGGFWVYKEYPPRYDPNDGEKYCQKTAYLFAFIWTTIIYVFLLVVLAAFPCFLICICFVSRTSSNEDDVEANLRAGEARSRGERTEQV